MASQLMAESNGFWRSAGLSYRSNCAQNTVPHDGGHVTHELHGCGPGIHAGCDDVLDRGFVVDVQLQIKNIRDVSKRK